MKEQLRKIVREILREKVISQMNESVNEAKAIGKKIFSNARGKLFFGYQNDDDTVKLVDYKTWKKLPMKDLSNEFLANRVINSIVRNERQLNKKVDYNMWSKKTNPSFEERMDYFIKNNWISNITANGIRESINEGNAFGMAVTKAKEEGKKEFEFNGKTYKVKKGSYEKKNESIKESVNEYNVNKKFSSKYDIGAGSMGNGTTFWNRAEEEFGDYKKIAHVSDNGMVKFYDKSLPSNVKKHIEDYAKTQKESVNEGKTLDENFIPKVGTIDDFQLKNLYLNNQKFINLLGNAEKKFVRKQDVVVIMHQTKKFNAIFTDGLKEFEVDMKAYKLVKPLTTARKEILNFFGRNESLKENSHSFGKMEYTKRNMTPTDILDLTYAYVNAPITKLVGKTLGHNVVVANDISKLTGTSQLDASKRGKSPALLIFLLKNDLVTKDEYIKLYKELVNRHNQVIQQIKKTSSAVKKSKGAAKLAAKDMKDEF